MKMVKVKTAELTGKALDWAVAEAAGLRPHLHSGEFWVQGGDVNMRLPQFSESWAQFGPLIERFRVGFSSWQSGWVAWEDVEEDGCGVIAHGVSHLQAACRAICVAKHGDEVEVPEVLL